MRKRSCALIIALSEWLTPGLEEEAIKSGADRFFPLPFPTPEMANLLANRFGESAEKPGDDSKTLTKPVIECLHEKTGKGN